MCIKFFYNFYFRCGYYESAYYNSIKEYFNRDINNVILRIMKMKIMKEYILKKMKRGETKKIGGIKIWNYYFTKKVSNLKTKVFTDDENNFILYRVHFSNRLYFFFLIHYLLNILSLILAHFAFHVSRRASFLIKFFWITLH